METNFLAPAIRGPSLAFYFGFQVYLFFQQASGARVTFRLHVAQCSTLGLFASLPCFIISVTVMSVPLQLQFLIMTQITNILLQWRTRVVQHPPPLPPEEPSLANLSRYVEDLLTRGSFCDVL